MLTFQNCSTAWIVLTAVSCWWYIFFVMFTSVHFAMNIGTTYVSLLFCTKDIYSRPSIWFLSCCRLFIRDSGRLMFTKTRSPAEFTVPIANCREQTTITLPILFLAIHYCNCNISMQGTGLKTSIRSAWTPLSHTPLGSGPWSGFRVLGEKHF